MMSSRKEIRDALLTPVDDLLAKLSVLADLTASDHSKITDQAVHWVHAVRNHSNPGVMELFLAEYGLSTDEGVALMCLAEALLRVPDDETVDDLIRDKIAPHDWAAHVGDSGSILINASTWALMFTGKVLDEEEPGVVGLLQGVVRRLGEPLVRRAVKRAMQELGTQFVLGETIAGATARSAAMEGRGYSYSYDMLGEAARTYTDAQRYFDAYADAIAALARQARSRNCRDNPGISVKLSALHPRYEQTQAKQMVPALSHKLLCLARLASDGCIGLNIDAEEANRLELSLDVIEQVLSDSSLKAWDGFGVVVQAYGKRAPHVIDWLHELAVRLDRRIMVRLVKGAYWDAEIKQAQVLGLPSYSVFTCKADTDVSYIACARKLLACADRIYPQFATHNAHTIAAVLQMAKASGNDFELQRLHGMGESLHDTVKQEHKTRCRIYAPVGAHEDLLAYLVRRLLENGANSSFVNQIVNQDVSAQTIAANPFLTHSAAVAHEPESAIRQTELVPLPADLYQPSRTNSRGFDVNDPADQLALQSVREPFLAPYQWFGASRANGAAVLNPARPDELVGWVEELSAGEADQLVERGLAVHKSWADQSIANRAAILNRTADLLEANAGEVYALLAREAGKTLADAVAELREAVDFLRYYAAQAQCLNEAQSPRGLIICISPWNFPLAIFTGQIAAALVTGNVVIAKPAEQTPLIAMRAVQWFQLAGVAQEVLQVAPGQGETIGAALTAHPRIAGVCFTGSTEVARVIERQLAVSAPTDAMLIAETGGLNAMVIDSTALAEQAVRDIVISAFQSAGQRCSALRMLYIQQEKYQQVMTMLAGAIDTLRVEDPLAIETDIGPLIDRAAQQQVSRYCSHKADAGAILKTGCAIPDSGYFQAPTVVKVGGIRDLQEEIFGPVLHVASFAADELDRIISDINERGFGLTLGLHTRIDSRAEYIVNSARVGNTYVNRSQIGAVVGSQPFGGEGLSGTGPKAGGPHYLPRFTRRNSDTELLVCDASPSQTAVGDTGTKDASADSRVAGALVEKAFGALEPNAWPSTGNKVGILRSVLLGQCAAAMAAAADLVIGPTLLPGPTGESNRLRLHPLGRVLCLGPEPEILLAHIVQGLRCGNTVVAVAPNAQAIGSFLAVPGLPLSLINGSLEIAELATLEIDALAVSLSHSRAREIRSVLARRSGKIVRVINQVIDPSRFAIERAVCIDTTAAGGNAQLLAQVT